MLRQLQDTLPEVWTQETYGPHFLRSPIHHKDFQHAALHIIKALGKLSSFIDDAEHAQAQNGVFDFPKDEIGKYLADLVICSSRMALTVPGGPIDLEEAVQRRFIEKMKRRLV